MRAKRSLTKRAFDQALKRCNLSERSAQMARGVLVDGKTHAEIGRAHGVTAQAVSQHVAAVWRAHTEASELPAGFRRITVVLPEDKAVIALSWERDEKIRLMQL